LSISRDTQQPNKTIEIQTIVAASRHEHYVFPPIPPWMPHTPTTTRAHTHSAADVHVHASLQQRPVNIHDNNNKPAPETDGQPLFCFFPSSNCWDDVRSSSCLFVTYLSERPFFCATQASSSQGEAKAIASTRAHNRQAGHITPSTHRGNLGRRGSPGPLTSGPAEIPARTHTHTHTHARTHAHTPARRATRNDARRRQR
jgi:hypothetical protein